MNIEHYEYMRKELLKDFEETLMGHFDVRVLTYPNIKNPIKTYWVVYLSCVVYPDLKLKCTLPLEDISGDGNILREKKLNVTDAYEARSKSQ